MRKLVLHICIHPSLYTSVTPPHGTADNVSNFPARNFLFASYTASSIFVVSSVIQQLGKIFILLYAWEIPKRTIFRPLTRWEENKPTILATLVYQITSTYTNYFPSTFKRHRRPNQIPYEHHSCETSVKGKTFISFSTVLTTMNE